MYKDLNKKAWKVENYNFINNSKDLQACLLYYDKFTLFFFPEI